MTHFINRIVKAFWVFSCIFLLTYSCWAETCSNIEEVQYKPEGDCNTVERKCCSNKVWSEWGGECSACQCKPGQTKSDDCNYVMGEDWYGYIEYKCDDSCQWKQIEYYCKDRAYISFIVETNLIEAQGSDRIFIDNTYNDIIIKEEESGNSVGSISFNVLHSGFSTGAVYGTYEVMSSDEVTLKPEIEYYVSGGKYGELRWYHYVNNSGGYGTFEQWNEYYDIVCDELYFTPSIYDDYIYFSCQLEFNRRI